MSPQFSIIIPVYNRPDEVDELLNSLSQQTVKQFEILIVEDGSEIDCKEIVNKYSDQLDISYYYIHNCGPGQARNYGARYAQGDYLIVLDSDCILPSGYISSVQKEIRETQADAFGGPDRALSTFTPIQKAINYSMTSLFTTGGIRGGKKNIKKFYPRSFNMGIRKSVYNALGGFSAIRFGEDIDFSIRIYAAGYKVALFLSAYVYHKRRNNFKTFFKQVYNSGIARINLYKKYPDTLKLTHFFPSCFLLFYLIALFVSPFCAIGLACVLLYSIVLFLHSTVLNGSLKVGLLSVIASFVQLTGYGAGFIVAFWKRIILRKDEFSAFEKNFYK